MSVAARVERYLAEHEIPWDAVDHSPSGCALDAAHRARLAPGVLAKAIVLEDDFGYVVAFLEEVRVV